MIAFAAKALGIGKAIFAPVGRVWRWLTADATRMGFAALIALCAFLAWRVWAIDGDRDDWRAKVEAYQAASAKVIAADKVADDKATAVAGQVKGQVDEGNQRAADAAKDSADPLADGFGSLRAETAGRGGQAAR